MKQRIVLLLMVTLLAFTFNTKAESNTGKLQFALWTKGVPTATDAQIITYFMSALKGNAIADVDLRANPTHYKQVYGEQGYQMLINAPASDFTVGYSSGNEQNWTIENGISVICGTLAAGVKIILYKGIPIAKWGSNGCLNALSVPVSPKGDPVDKDNSDGGTLPNKNQPDSNPGNRIINNNNNNNVIPGNNSGNDMLSFYNGMIVRENHTLTDLSMFERMMLLKQQQATSCNTCPQGNASQQQQAIYTQPQMVAPATQVAYYPPQQGYTNGHLDVTVTNKTRVVDWFNAAANVAQGVAGIKQAFWPEDVNVNLRGLTNNVGYNNGYWGTGTTGSGFQGSNQQGNIIGTAFNTGTTGNTNTSSYGNTWGNNSTSTGSTGGGGLVRIGY